MDYMVTLFTKKKLKVVLSARIIIIEIWIFFKQRSMLNLHIKSCEDWLSTDYCGQTRRMTDADQKIRSIDQIGLRI